MINMPINFSFYFCAFAVMRIEILHLKPPLVLGYSEGMYCNYVLYPGLVAKIGISGYRIWSKIVMEPIFKPCGEFRWSPEGPVSQIHSPHLHVGAPGIFSDLFWSAQSLKREWGAEINGKLPHLVIPSKTATLVPEFAVEDLSLGTTAALVPEVAVKDLPLGRTLWW